MADLFVHKLKKLASFPAKRASLQPATKLPSTFRTVKSLRGGELPALPSGKCLQKIIRTRTHKRPVITVQKLHSRDTTPLKQAMHPVVMTPNYVLQHMAYLLSPLEKEEIQAYPVVYYLGNQCWRGRDYRKVSQEDGTYIFYEGDHIEYRYEVIGLLGAGTFGTVCKAYDHKLHKTVAIKVVNNGRLFTQQARVEAELLKKLSEFDAGQVLVEFSRNFRFRGHTCLVFELLETSLGDALAQNEYRGFAEDALASIGKQVLASLEYVHRHSVIHCDLKPQNLMFADMKELKVKLIDFGTSCYKQKKAFSYIQSRFYRAPEIVLGCSYTEAIDVWSFGCVLYELATGKPLFACKNQEELLVKMIECIGLPTKDLVFKGRKSSQYFDIEGQLINQTVVPGSKPFSLLAPNCSTQLLDLISRCLKWRPEDRLTPEEALTHQFFYR